MRATAAALILLAGCTGATTHPLAGEWVMMADVLEYPLACGSHGPVVYHADGTYALWGEAGTWRLNGNRLTERTTSFEPLHVERSAEDIGKPVMSTLQWADQNAFLKQYADGSVRAFRRCPKTQ